tara:strand:+ start:512 stop:697 length:186 start_codon:yes stop_codon:yes gene_type:complete
MIPLNTIIKQVKNKQKRLNKKDIKFLLSISINILCDSNINLSDKEKSFLFKYIDNLTNINK